MCCGNGTSTRKWSQGQVGYNQEWSWDIAWRVPWPYIEFHNIVQQVVLMRSIYVWIVAICKYIDIFFDWDILIYFALISTSFANWLIEFDIYPLDPRLKNCSDDDELAEMQDRCIEKATWFFFDHNRCPYSTTSTRAIYNKYAVLWCRHPKKLFPFQSTINHSSRWKPVVSCGPKFGLWHRRWRRTQPEVFSGMTRWESLPWGSSGFLQDHKLHHDATLVPNLVCFWVFYFPKEKLERL